MCMFLREIVNSQGYASSKSSSVIDNQRLTLQCLLNPVLTFTPHLRLNHLQYKICDPKKLTHLFQHSDFIAIRELHTFQAVGPDFVGEHCLIHFLKTQLLKKIRLIGERKNPLHS